MIFPKQNWTDLKSARRLKANFATADIPVVFLTGASSSEEKVRGLEMGDTDYLTKPFDPAEAAGTGEILTSRQASDGFTGA